MHWAAIRWAKSQGYGYFDLGGISPELAKSIQSFKTRPLTQAYKMDHFKLGFGGKATLFPEPTGYVHNPVLRWAWPLLSASLARFLRLRRLTLT
jgi:lipid II:glycine glycyltransferase (peptidoglycan interpeptide bridge formation enzyme)